MATKTKKRGYQWAREDFRKAYNRVFLVRVVLVVCFIVAIVLLNYFGIGVKWQVAALAIFVMLVFTNVGWQSAIRWADKKLKSLALGDKG